MIQLGRWFFWAHSLPSPDRGTDTTEPRRVLWSVKSLDENAPDKPTSYQVDVAPWSAVDQPMAGWSPQLAGSRPDVLVVVLNKMRLSGGRRPAQSKHTWTSVLWLFESSTRVESTSTSSNREEVCVGKGICIATAEEGILGQKMDRPSQG